MLSKELRDTLEEFVRDNEAKITECDKTGFAPKSQVATLVDHLKRQNELFGRILQSHARVG